MVSLWPWKGDDNSPASFEKALSGLAAKITQSQAHLDALRSNARRSRALWTLYSSFGYLLCFVILFLVVGWQNWTIVEYIAVAGSPLLIYLIRTAINTYYTYRIDSASHRLEEQQATRAKTIDKLKAATKYNSTQELLEKYGGAPPKPKKENKPPSKSPKSTPKTIPGRIGGGPPPPTANIARPNQIPSQPSTPQPQTQNQIQISNNSPQFSSPSPARPPVHPDAGNFAPNAFAAPQQYAQGTELSVGGHWYDRVLDLLMGEDETSPKNRIALICQNCRLVNGQAPPGTKSPADLGKWRCYGCAAWNGEDEAAEVVEEMRKRIEAAPASSSVAEAQNESGSEDAKNEVSEVINPEDNQSSADDTNEVAKPKRGRPKGSKNKA